MKFLNPKPYIKKNPQIRGLGDLISKVSEPIKNTIINHSPENIAKMVKNCNCKGRQEYLNNVFPNPFLTK